jgi:hypothetical protein
MRTARLDPRLTASPEALESASGRCVWTIEEVGDRVGGPMPSPETPYLGAELVTRQPGRMLRPDEAQSLAVVELDNTSGVRTVRAPVRQPAKSRSFEMPAFDLGAAYEARRLMYQQVGMQRAFWIPSWQRDLPIAAAAIAGATTIAVHECGYATNIFPAGVAKRHVVLRSPSGASVQARKVTNATTDGSTETLTLDTPLSAGIDSSTLAMFLRYVRFDADEMTFEWDGRATFVALPVVDLSEETPA